MPIMWLLATRETPPLPSLLRNHVCVGTYVPTARGETEGTVSCPMSCHCLICTNSHTQSYNIPFLLSSCFPSFPLSLSIPTPFPSPPSPLLLSLYLSSPSPLFPFLTNPKSVVHDNMLTSMKAIVTAMGTLDIPLAVPENKVRILHKCLCYVYAICFVHLHINMVARNVLTVCTLLMHHTWSLQCIDSMYIINASHYGQY